MDHDSAHEKRFPVNNSVMYIGTARSEVFGRGEPIHNLLFSECAFYPPEAWDKAIAPALQRVPIDGRVLMESTPNGQDPVFYEHIQDVLEGKSSFGLTVLYWWDELTNQLPLDHPIGVKFDRSPDNEEDMLISRHNLTEEQLRWRRWKKEELRDLFLQEHIEDLGTAFLVSGFSYYDPELVANIQRSWSEPITTQAEIKIYEHPDPAGQYILGGDPGQGKVTKSVACVTRIDTDPVRQVAVISNKMRPDEFAIASVSLAEKYNKAFLVPEVNGHGLAYTQKIDELGYSNTYHRTSLISGRQTSELGWYTSGTSKPFMMSELHRHLRNGAIVPDYETVKEIAGARVEDGKVHFLGFDDHHDAFGLSLVGIQTYFPAASRGVSVRSRRYSRWT